MSNENQFRDEPEYDPNSKDITDDPNFLGDNDHGDAIPKPKCASCGVPWADHMGIMGVCLNNKALKEDLKDLREENAQLRKERDAALAVVNEFISDTTVNNETPIHECGFYHDPEKGKCDACEAWGNFVGLFCSNEEEETQ